jgi:hypothetical protein
MWMRPRASLETGPLPAVAGSRQAECVEGTNTHTRSPAWLLEWYPRGLLPTPPPGMRHRGFLLGLSSFSRNQDSGTQPEFSFP